MHSQLYLSPFHYLALKVDGEIVNVDSLDIGTALARGEEELHLGLRIHYPKLLYDLG